MRLRSEIKEMAQNRSSKGDLHLMNESKNLKVEIQNMKNQLSQNDSLINHLTQNIIP